MRIAISAGHGKYVQGAVGIINEVDEARAVVQDVAEQLKLLGVTAVYFFDDTSTDQQTNLETIVDWHNNQDRDLDISVHFNAYIPTDEPMGTECLYVTQEDLATRVAAAIADASGLVNRGPKQRTDLYFLNNTTAPAILIEVCFVDSVTDTELYDRDFDDICEAIAVTVSGAQEQAPLPVRFAGTVSWFGGPDDTTGVAPDEGLAFFYEYSDAPHLFLDQQPPDTTGLARRLNADGVPYVACRWDYDVTPKELLREKYPALVRSLASGEQILAWPADWGPHEEKTGRAADVSPYVMKTLGLETDDEVEVIYPAPMPVVARVRRERS